MKQMNGFLSAAISLLPNRARRAVAHAVAPTLSTADRFGLIASIAAGVNIDRFIVSGQQGVFESLSSDNVVLLAYAATGTWANRTTSLITAELEGTSGTYIDIGANIGLTAIPIAKLHGINCFAFEPEPANFESLSRNAARNAPGANLSLFQLALADVSGVASFSIARGNLGDHKFFYPGGRTSASESDSEHREIIEVPVDRLDALKLNITDPLVIKIDTQGAESKILRGGGNTIGRAKLLVMEFWPYQIAKFQENEDELLTFLGSNFGSIAYASGEDGAVSSAQSNFQSIEYLQSYFRKNLEKPENYIDIIARNP
jgi:FkbM family methyltransferase